jgi:hypothetical protein
MNIDPNDPDSFLNQIHTPEDAGEYEEDLKKILGRIPLRWGRWISCNKGWYPMLIELDQKLAEIFPDYELHQVKEKFGTLRYYIGFPELNPQCCIDLDAARPHKGAVDPKWLHGQERTAQDQYELDTWFYKEYIPHFDSEEHAQQQEALEPEQERRRALSDQMHEIIAEYENKSGSICEETGTPGVMMRRGYWYKTLNPDHAPEGFIVSVSEEEED